MCSVSFLMLFQSTAFSTASDFLALLITDSSEFSFLRSLTFFLALLTRDTFRSSFPPSLAALARAYQLGTWVFQDKESVLSRGGAQTRKGPMSSSPASCV